ncbi:MAG: PTS sugar transporter subunit IIA [bacterium]
MKTGILLMTHPGIGEALEQTAAAMLGKSLDTDVLGCLEIDFDADTELALELAGQQVVELDQGQGVLILTDSQGATPSNIACKLLPSHPVRVIAGINLPMLVRSVNYAHLDVDALCDVALTGGQRGITEATSQSCEAEL